MSRGESWSFSQGKVTVDVSADRYFGGRGICWSAWAAW